MSEIFYLSRKNYDKLREELDGLKKIKAELSEEIGEAARQGDLKENAEYAAAKEKQAETLARINELEIRLRNTRITDDLNVDRSEARIGATVTIEDLSNGGQFTYTLVGSMESNPEEGLLSVKTPVAAGLLTARAASAPGTGRRARFRPARGRQCSARWKTATAFCRAVYRAASARVSTNRRSGSPPSRQSYLPSRQPGSRGCN